MSQVSSETDLALGPGATRRAGGPGKTFEYSLGIGTLLLDLALQGEHTAQPENRYRRPRPRLDQNPTFVAAL